MDLFGALILLFFLALASHLALVYHGLRALYQSLKAQEQEFDGELMQCRTHLGSLVTQLKTLAPKEKTLISMLAEAEEALEHATAVRDKASIYKSTADTIASVWTVFDTAKRADRTTKLVREEMVALLARLKQTHETYHALSHRYNALRVRFPNTLFRFPEAETF